jgi:flagella basal body P-ring formation protein FlgA
MRIILLIGLFCVGGAWWPDAGRVLAAPPQSGRGGEQTLAAVDFEKAVYSALTRQYGRPQHLVSVQILFPKKPLKIQAGTIHLEVEKLAGGARTGRRAFRVGLFIDKQFIKTINVVGEVRAQVTVTAPTRWIKPNEVVVAQDVTAMTVDVPSLTHDFILHQDEVIGKQVLRPLPPRQPIRKSMVDDPPIVHKGDRVTIEVRQGGLLVQAVGLAKAAGKSGDTIPVQNKSSGREVIGTILSAGLVEVGF